MNEEEKKAFNATIENTIKTHLPSIVDAVVDAKVAEMAQKSASDMDGIKAEIKSLAVANKFTDKAKDMFTKTAVVSIIKDVLKHNITSESAFKSIVDANIKTMTEGTATEGAELVFDQFEQSVQMVLNTFDLVSLVKIIPIAKGDKLNLPKVTNGITTAYVTETNAPSASEPDTAFITIDIVKAMTLTHFTEELLEDTMTIPDLYDMIVQTVAESQGAFLEKQILAGTGGSTAVEGLLTNASVLSVQLSTASHRASNISDANIVDVYTKALRKYKRNRANLRWITSQYVLGKLQALKTTDGYPLYPELRGESPTLFGHAVILTDDSSIAQDLAGDVAAKPTIIFGDLSYFVLVRRKGLTLERGYINANWASNIISLKSVSRFGGKATFGEAFVKLLNAAT